MIITLMWHCSCLVFVLEWNSLTHHSRCAICIPGQALNKLRFWKLVSSPWSFNLCEKIHADLWCTKIIAICLIQDIFMNADPGCCAGISRLKVKTWTNEYLHIKQLYIYMCYWCKINISINYWVLKPCHASNMQIDWLILCV